MTRLLVLCSLGSVVVEDCPEHPRTTDGEIDESEHMRSAGEFEWPG